MRRRLALLLVCTALAVGCSDAAGTAAGEASPAAATSGGEPAVGSSAASSTVPTAVPGVLTACLAPTPGVAELAAGEWRGFDAAVLRAVAAELDLRLELVPSVVDDVVSGVALADATCDVAAGGLVDAAALAGVGRTSTGYRTVHHLVVGTGPATLVEPQEVTGSVGVVDGTPGAGAAPALSAAEVVAYPSRADLALALSSGAVDAALTSTAGRVALADLVEEDLVVHSTVPTDEQTVLLLAPTAPDGLVEAVDAALEALRATDRLRVLHDRWLHG